MNWYNENDPKAAAWLRELIAQNLIAPGIVDERSITDVKPEELEGFKQCHFFAGIGGWSLALRFAGWPDDEEVWTGSCPCQPFSVAGKAEGVGDERHLWPTFHRLIAQRRPAIVFGEQVASKDGRSWLAGVRTDLEGIGYAVGAADLCAAGVGSPHIRQRLYWVSESSRGGLGKLRHANQQRSGGHINGGSPSDGLPNTQSNHRRGEQQTEGEGSGRCGPSGNSGLVHAALPAEERFGSQQEHLPGSTGERMGESIREGLEKRESNGGIRPGKIGAPTRKTTELSGAWDNWDICHFTDGKVRRIESGTSPLADGVPARVVRLRGYGNAIVPQVAKEFILAYLETNCQ